MNVIPAPIPPQPRDSYFQNDYPDFDWCSLHVEHSILPYRHFQKHTHNFSEAFILLSGSTVHLVEDRAYPVGKGCVCVLKGDTVHGFRDCENLEIINLMYDSRTFFGVQDKLRTIPGFDPLFLIEPEIRSHKEYPCSLILEDEDLERVKTLSDLAIDLLAKGKKEYSVTIQMLFFTLVSFLSARYVAQGGTAQKIQVLARAIRFMEEHLATPIWVGDVAGHAMVSPRHLERLFCEYYGKSPVEYLTEARLRRSLAMLSRTDLDVTEVAERCGFSDPSYFSRVFKQNYGVSPSKVTRRIVY